MSRKWKPGAVALFTGSVNQIALRVEYCGNPTHPRDHWHLTGGTYTTMDDYIRPLVVIDPEDREQVKALLVDYLTNAGGLCSLITDPKPEEPTGLGAVVENDMGHRYVRESDGWWRSDESCTLNWVAVHAVKILSAGWSE